MKPTDLDALLPFLTEEERNELDALIAEDMREIIWTPLPGPQTMAYESRAAVIGFGGAAGGGKTDLACGLALTQHRIVQFFRRVSTETGAIIDRFQELCGARAAGRPPVLRGVGRAKVIEFGSVPNLGDETAYQGRGKDLLVIDEAANFLEAQVRFLMGWVRTTSEGQLAQTLMTFNPPTTAEGRWLVEFFGPWLDRKHPLYPTAPGALRWVAVIDGRDEWLPDDDPRPFVLVGGKRTYEFDPADHKPTAIIKPQSRTFIPSRITDNPFLMGTDYMTQLQAMPEPLRSQMLNGDFEAGMEDDAFQVCPTAWVEVAMARWKDHPQKPPMDSMGVDVARGGRDNTIIFKRHEGMWFDRPDVHPGSETPNGPVVAGLCLAAQRDGAPIHIDVIGVGGSPFDFLMDANIDTHGINVSEAAMGKDVTGKLGFFNLRSQLWWRMREALDPANNTGIALPPDRRLLADLCAPRWSLQGHGVIKVEGRDDIIKRIGRSPDWASAAILALIDTPKRLMHVNRFTGKLERQQRSEYNPSDHAAAGMRSKGRSEYDPTAIFK